MPTKKKAQPKKQTRRTVSLGEEDFQKLSKIGAKTKQPLSQILTGVIEQWAGMPPSVAEEAELTPKVASPGQPGYVVNVDFMVHADNPNAAETKIKNMMKEHKLKGMVIAADPE